MGTENSIVDSEAQQERTPVMGTHDENLAEDLFGKSIWAALPKKDRNTKGARVVRRFIQEMQPQNPVETMVYSQMYALHSHAMALMADAQKTLSIDCREQYLSLANRLIKTFNHSLEILGKFKRQGVQVVRVESVNVNNGGQAIVGAVSEEKKRGGV